MDHKVKWTPFVDHHPPPLALLCKIIDTMAFWLRSDINNVAVVHCVGGKGRTGTSRFILSTTSSLFLFFPSYFHHSLLLLTRF